VLSRRRERWVLATLVLVVGGPLALIKLGGFVGIHSLEVTGIGTGSAVPIGVSFYSLQALSYIIDVYRGTGEATPDLETHALYLAFFPQLLAGPIERAGRLVPQLRELAGPSCVDLYVGAKTMLWGYFLKLAVADNVGTIVDRVFMSTDRVQPAAFPAALYLYSFQLYFDFLGYTIIAVGLGRTFGVRITSNFDRPYLSASLREFWRRWHITLSSWLRDYVYVPLGGRRGYVRFALAISVTFVASGVWHGAGANFLVWGALHAALFLSADALGRIPWPQPTALRTHSYLRLAVKAVQIAVCFSAVSFAWLFFRVESMSAALNVLGAMWDWLKSGAALELPPLFYRSDTIFFLSLLALAFILDSTRIAQRVLESVPTTGRQVGAELALVNTLALAVVLFGDLGGRQFIYFRF
jgi:alginate O-acetyltransferase complex protein AlgI